MWKHTHTASSVNTKHSAMKLHTNSCSLQTHKLLQKKPNPWCSGDCVCVCVHAGIQWSIIQWGCVDLNPASGFTHSNEGISLESLINRSQPFLHLFFFNPNFCPPWTLLFLCSFLPPPACFTSVNSTYSFSSSVVSPRPAPDQNQSHEIKREANTSRSEQQISIFVLCLSLQLPRPGSVFLWSAAELSSPIITSTLAAVCLIVIVLCRRTLTLCASSMSLTEPENKKIFNYQQGFGGAGSIKM